jgi:hypothetical protein
MYGLKDRPNDRWNKTQTDKQTDQHNKYLALCDTLIMDTRLISFINKYFNFKFIILIFAEEISKTLIIMFNFF